MFDASKLYYTPKQFHFHAPSEHTVDGKYFDAEMHFVHTVKGSGLNGSADVYGAVIGIFFDVEEGGSDTNSFLESVFEAIESRGESGATAVDVRQFLNTIDMGDYWNYPGSFTTPPCTEGINWNVVKQV